MISSIIERLNSRRDGTGDAGADAGFTLIELMVVLLIMAILLAIAIPTFLGVSNSANDRASQSNLNTALTNAKSYYDSNSQTFTGATEGALLSSLQSQEPSISWVSGPTTASGVISVAVASDGNAVALASYSSPTKTCWYLVDNEATESATSWPTTPPTAPQYGAGTWYGGAKGPATCDAAVIPAAGTTAGLVKWNTAGSAGFVPAPG
jgi:type IV pilus assembly protein PilA